MIRRLLPLALVAALACTNFTGPDFRPLTSLEVLPYTLADHPLGFNLDAYPADWARMEACSGLTGDLAALRFYVTTGPELTIATPWGPAVAVYLVEEHAILFTRVSISDQHIVRHEMLHALRRRGGHPPVFDTCGVREGASLSF